MSLWQRSSSPGKERGGGGRLGAPCCCCKGGLGAAAAQPRAPRSTLRGAQGGFCVCFIPRYSHTSGPAGEMLVSCLGKRGAVSIYGAALNPSNPRGHSRTQDPISKPQQPSG